MEITHYFLEVDELEELESLSESLEQKHMYVFFGHRFKWNGCTSTFSLEQ